MHEGSIIDSCQSWVNFIRSNTLGHLLYPLASAHHGDCILHYWEWHAQGLRDFLLLRRNRSFMSEDLFGIILGKLKPKHYKDPEDLSG